MKSFKEYLNEMAKNIGGGFSLLSTSEGIRQAEYDNFNKDTHRKI